MGTDQADVGMEPCCAFCVVTAPCVDCKVIGGHTARCSVWLLEVLG